MILNSSRWSATGVVFLTLGLATGAIVSLLPSTSSPVSAAPNADGNFPDTANHWAQPFIQSLAEKKIITGYPDNTYKPNRPVNRDEYAAIIRKAFNQKRERRIPNPSITYKDVPTGYWAASAIEEAYESGFMNGYPGGYFRPNQGISRAEALVSLSKNLDLRRATATSTSNQTAISPASTNPTVTSQTTTQAAAQPTSRRTAKKQFTFPPLAMLTLMQPLMAAPARAQSAMGSPRSVNSSQSATSQASTPATSTSQSTQPAPAAVVNNYYDDAEKIPDYAVAPVAAATRAGLVVNHPRLRMLNPNRPATRGEIAAFIHQALVSQGYLAPLSANVNASNYVVGREQLSSQQTQP